jgi:hypothetical protein
MTEVTRMRETIKRALARHREERGDTRPVPGAALVCIPADDSAVFAPVEDVTVHEGGDAVVEGGRHLITDTTVAVEEVR